MNSLEKPVSINNTQDIADVALVDLADWRMRVKKIATNSELRNVFATFLTTLAVFGIFFVQGIILARILGPLGRGEFGTSIQIPRDLLLYAGLLGGIEIVNSYASKGVRSLVRLKYSAARMGLITGTITAIVAGVSSIVFLLLVGKAQLIPFCLICCLFLPWEHMHLIISGVDRGNHAYARYNFNRLFFAAAFPVLVLLAFPTGLIEFLGLGQLTAVCLLFVISKVVGLLPTLRGMDVLGFVSRKLTGGSVESNAVETSGASSGATDVDRGMQRFRENSPADARNVSQNPYQAPVAESSIGEAQEVGNETSDEVPSTRKLLKEGQPYALSVFASELFERMDVLLIVALGTLVECGYYMVAIPAAALLTVAPNALGVFTFNAGADENRHIKTREAVGVVSFVVVLQIISTIVLALLIPWLIVTFYTAAFQPSIEFALWLLPAAAIKGYLQSADGYLKGRGKPIIGVWSRVISTVAMLLFVWLTFSQFENRLISIPIAACFGQAISMLIITYYVFADIRNRSVSGVADASA